MKILDHYPLAAVVLAAALLGGIFAWNGLSLYEWARNRFNPPPRGRSSWSHPLKALASAEAYFRANTSSENGTHDFWRKDVAGLYGAHDKAGAPLRLIELSTALADDRPVTDLSAYGKPAPRWGQYWCRALFHEGEDPRHPDPQRFAFAMTPLGTPDGEQYSYIIDENNSVFRAKVPTVTVFPRDPGKAGWSKMD